jgi:Zn-dependent peptidase ImmA (M78 family)
MTNIREQQLPLLKEFISYVKEFLKLNDLPPLTLSYKPDGAKEMGSFGGYNPNNKKITLNVYNRHQADVFRTLAHELNHYKQDILKQLTPESGKTGHPHENECNAVAAIILRNFANNYPDMFTPNKI